MAVPACRPALAVSMTAKVLSHPAVVEQGVVLIKQEYSSKWCHPALPPNSLGAAILIYPFRRGPSKGCFTRNRARRIRSALGGLGDGAPGFAGGDPRGVSSRIDKVSN